jgi:predicted SAM-dependent methyltransferase
MTSSPSSPADRAHLSPHETGGIKKVSVGCGPNHIRPDWWNVDIRRFEGIDEKLDATRPWPWSGLDFVFAEHFLEHLTLEQAIQFVQHAASALKVGGRLRLSTPSLEYVLKTHFSFDSAEDRFNQTLGLNRAFHGWGHQFLYSREVLQRLFVDSKLVDVKFFAYGESDTAELRDLERHKNGRGSRFGFPGVWIVEGARGEALPGMDAAALQVYRDVFIRYCGKH